MSFRLRAALAAALAVPALTATSASAAPVGEVVIVAGGHATGTVTFPAAVTVLLGGAKYETKSPYTLFAFIRNGWVEAGIDRYAEARGPQYALTLPSTVPAGRTTVRVLSSGPVTIRVPVRGMRGRLVVRLNKPLPGAVAHRVVPAAVGGAALHSDVPLRVAARAVTIHGYLNRDGTTVARADAMCVSPRPCDWVSPSPSPSSEYFRTYWPGDGIGGDQHAQLTIADVGQIGNVVQYVLSMPLS